VHRRRTTAQDVADKAGVSRTTVSFVLNNTPGVNIPKETRERVLVAARELNYVPDAAARSLASRRARTIGFILCQSPDRIFADAFLPEVLRGLGRITRENNVRLLVESVEDVTRPDAYLNLARAKQIDGIILSGPRSDDQQLPQLVAEGFPVVLQGRLPESAIPFVDVDNVGGAWHAVTHLLNLGYQRVACITNAPPEYTASADRLCGYRRALEEARMSYDEALVRYGNFDEKSGYKAMNELLALADPPDAVFIASDLVAFGAVVAIKNRALRIPEDIAIVGFDDVPLASFVDPPLTTVHLPAANLGRTAGQILLTLIQGKKLKKRQVLLETELVIRESCGSPRATVERG
jgi:DNA-binding LacI/PurR family transcriptional regulator